MTMVTYGMVQKIANEASGIVDETIRFHAVFVNPAEQVKKGLFVPLEDAAETLKTAIEHGAIASFWPIGEPLPRYIPNQFPLFFVPSPLAAAAALLERYLREGGRGTEFSFSFPEEGGEYVPADEAIPLRLAELQKRWLDARQAKGCDDSCQNK
ncbi:MULTISPECIES: hypothetical protein [Geobacillus]|uniref:Uncharacterized protein n=1 Tax=Geobacillus stearothermophilus TaxID=1422 RepID=A0A150N9L9_GEOSE|nr:MULTISPECIES: hypothetical protein [Geobacillus]KAF6512080.1 hypothetical protein GS8_379 [Geobacillus stearothermophilus]KMY59247.1 hypothetical protein AA906_09010 [Geobacillus stearothermophilus]KOR95034.1 hypothetical protein N231_04265 [Geobacillus stearothermophilus ATCC 12980]KYD33413.1 hypothetical protein B4114_1023 [Geobacillus stearothermophilus]MBR2516286.1 hypothetical protein [Geobacillus sp.]